MLNIFLSPSYTIVFDGAHGSLSRASENTERETIRSSALLMAARHTHPDTPFGAHEAVVEKDAHPLGDYGDHSIARFIDGKQVFPT